MLNFVQLLPAVDSAPPMLSNAEIRALLVERVDTERQSLGMVAGVVTSDGSRFVSYGRLSRDERSAPDQDTVFEVGSVTKVFTGLLLAQMLQSGQVRLDDPVARYLPGRVHPPAGHGKEIELVDLATQSSGLPWWPPRPPYADPHDPFAHYTVQQLFDALGTTHLAHDPGTAYGYSNFGFGVLGQALANRSGEPYAEMVRTRITEPLGMRSTGVALSAAMQSRLAPGHTARLRPAEHWQMGALAGAGGLHSSAHDLLLFLAAELGLIRTPLASAMTYQLQAVRRKTDTPGMEIALAWRISRMPHGEVVWHSGGTGGFAAFIGLDPQARRGVVVLSNAANEVSDLGMHLLDSSVPLRPPVEKKH